MRKTQDRGGPKIEQITEEEAEEVGGWFVNAFCDCEFVISLGLLFDHIRDDLLIFFVQEEKEKALLLSKSLETLQYDYPIFS